MKYLLSINNKFFKIKAQQLIDITSTSFSQVDGFEIAFDFFDDFEKSYVIEFASKIFEKNKILNFHGNSNLSIENQKKYLDFVYELSNGKQKNVSVVFHSIYDIDKNLSFAKTKDYLKELLDYAKFNNYPFLISVENLNILNNQKRLTKEDLTPMIKSLDNLFFTFDIGHELIDEQIFFNQFKDLSIELVSKISNIHIHCFVNKDDHFPILKNCKFIDYYKEKFNFLKSNNYDGYVVLEYGITFFEGNNFVDKLTNYTNSLTFIKSIL